MSFNPYTWGLYIYLPYDPYIEKTINRTVANTTITRTKTSTVTITTSITRIFTEISRVTLLVSRTVRVFEQ